ncbi:hypothetical protein B0H14DRAFT_3903957 [Mycena olivaceomarginata]|nr:hypothetical protein B0H14DRAFT_3903957 [Mycena olivaceomarginata]
MLDARGMGDGVWHRRTQDAGYMTRDAGRRTQDRRRRPCDEEVFQYPGTPAAGSAFGSPAIPAASPFAVPMQPPTMTPDDMLRAYVAKHASAISTSPSQLSAVRTIPHLPLTNIF